MGNLGRMAEDDGVQDSAGREQDKIILGKLNRIPKALRDELCEGASLRSCRSALEAEGHAWKLASGALIFVHPFQYRAVILTLSCHDLRPYHVVFSESLGYLVDEALAQNKGSWMETNELVDNQDPTSTQAGSLSDARSLEAPGKDHEIDQHMEGRGSDCCWELCIRSTFISLVPHYTSAETQMT